MRLGVVHLFPAGYWLENSFIYENHLESSTQPSDGRTGFTLQEVAEGCREDKALEDMMKSSNLQKASLLLFLVSHMSNSRRQKRTGKLGMLQSMGLQRVRHDLVTKQQQTSHAFSWTKYGWAAWSPGSFPVMSVSVVLETGLLLPYRGSDAALWAEKGRGDGLAFVPVWYPGSWNWP